MPSLVMVRLYCALTKLALIVALDSVNVTEVELEVSSSMITPAPLSTVHELKVNAGSGVAEMAIGSLM